MSKRRNERLVNLVICLLSTRRFLTATEIARTVPGYEHNETDVRDHAAFQRMFERDKAELRELGVPLEVGTTSIFDTESGYRIAQRDYALPAIELDPAAAAAVGLAARLWQNASLSSAASSGLRKLRAAGAIGGADDGSDSRLFSSVELSPVTHHEPSLESFLAATRQRKAVRFGYQQRSWGVEGQASEPAVRELQPWGVVAWRGRWYVVGHDLQRDAPRCFRLSRVTGEVKLFGSAGSYSPPEDLNLLSYVAKFAPPEHKNVARIRVGRHAAAGLRRWASSVEPDPDSEGGDPTDVLTLSYDRREWFAARLTAYGAAVTVLEPADLREEVITRLLVLAGTPPMGVASSRSALAGRSV